MALERFYQWRIDADVDEKDHQTKAFKWCDQRERDRDIRGGILADEMGLGKTIVMLGLIVSRFENGGTLVVVPKAILDQWRDQIQRFLNHDVVVYHGDRATEYEMLAAPLVLTTYGTIISRWRLFIQKEWGRLICDEAHHCRNPKTRCFAAVGAIDAHIKWLVTGTPIQNKVADIRSLFYILGCGREGIFELIKKYLLRRTKSSVGVSMPSLKFHEDTIEWTSDESGVSDEIHQMAANAIHAPEWGDILSHLNNGMLVAILRARQMCTLPKMIHTAMRDYEGDNRDEFCEKLTAVSKLDAVLQKINTRKHNGRRKIIFCHFLLEIKLCVERLERMGFRVGTISGKTSKRMDVLKSSNDILVVQIQTACEGLNLQEYSEVYFTSPHWNPAVEDQAIARCHRLGQTEDVDVFRFSMESFESEDSLDKCIKMRQKIKKKLAEDLGF
ncbi:hypothetical protein [uncultured Mediterranean phage]|nr:hypothetical protein [uncultured Mediterranean phage]